MEIYIDASMKMKMTSRIVRGRVSLETIKLTSRSPQVLVQEELDDAGFLSREILQRIVNDILKQGVPIPLTLGDRAMLLETNFQLNQRLIQQLTGEKLA
ncbi:unnamed protein product [Cylicostephanus goldi]|uniref:Lipid-binding serum glycoprotein C-terminal domain-containing protein n=1 Tax=Cylicostephanus goldi TaxID=71465 RepID=A0A3P7QQU7_CYLGO|nr:unnamed protein product [Cylicostephanus goldi]